MTKKRTLERKLEQIREICENSVESDESPYALLGRIEAISAAHQYDDLYYGRDR